jgi:carbohydrate binding protein with CBM6 domain
MNVRAQRAWWWMCVCVWLGLMVSVRAFAAAPQEIVLYAIDAANLHGNWSRSLDAAAGGGQILASADAGGSNLAAPLPAPNDYADFSFEAPSGQEYRLWIRLRAKGNSKWNDSIWVQYSDSVDPLGAPVLRIGSSSGVMYNLENCSGCGTSGWGWPAGAYWFAQPLTVRFATTGPHTLRVQIREDGVELDQVVLSPTSYISAAPGPVVSDQTIVERPIVSTPYLGTARALPGTIQAEDFDDGSEGSAYHDATVENSGGDYRTTGVDLQSSSEAGSNVGWIAPGEWLNYSVNVAASGSYLLEARVAAAGQGGTFHIESHGRDITGPLTIPGTGDWQAWATVSKPVTLQGGPQVFRVVFDASGSCCVGNLNWLRISSTEPRPYAGSAVSLPGTIGAENFDEGGEGLAYHDTSGGNSGGQYRTTDVDIQTSSLGGLNVGWITAGEWTRYSVAVSSGGTYSFAVRVASPNSSGRFHAVIGAVNTQTFTVPNTGAWQNWTTVTFNADLAAGPTVIRLVFDEGGFNVADIKASLLVPPPAPPTLPPTPPAAPPSPPPPPPAPGPISDRIARPKPSLPSLGPAGSRFVDPVFGSAISRVTDASTRPAAMNRSFRTPSASHTLAWNTASNLFYVVSTDGTVVPYSLSPSTGTASRIPAANGDGGLTLLFNAEPEFSAVFPNLIYGVIYGVDTRRIAAFDFNTRAYSTLLDLDTVGPSLSGTYVGGIAVGAMQTERMMVFFGGPSQDRHFYALWFSTDGSGTRKLLNTLTSTLNGVPTNVPLNFRLHSASIDRSGRFVFLYPTAVDLGAPRHASQVYVWDTDADTFTALTSGGADGSPATHSGGHDAPGYGYSVNHDCCVSTSWDAGQWEMRRLDAPVVAWDLVSPVLTPQEIYLSDHPTWNNARPDALVPFIDGTFRYGNNPAPWRAWDDEIIGVQTDVPLGATVWRYAHHRSVVGSDTDASVPYFWYEPRPNVSRDGRWVIFTSNWEKTLGTDPGTSTYRQDVFLLALP